MTDSVLTGRQAWTGNSNGFITTTVNLPAASFGQNVQFRWRMAYDTGTNPAGGGQRIDTITVYTVTRLCYQAVAAPPATLFDFTGDGKADLSVYTSSSNTWRLQDSATLAAAPAIVGWGSAGDILVPADYDGDRKTDIAVYRSSEFNFYIINSATNTVSIKSWGINGDILVPADYDGDGKADVAIVRPAPADQWWILRSSNNTVMDNGTPGFPPPTGTTGDIAVPSVYIAAPTIP